MPPLVGAKRTKNPDGSFMSRFCERTRNGFADLPRLDLVVGVAIARIEAAAVADHHLQLRMLRRLGIDALAVGELERQRLFAEDVLAGLQRLDDLLGVQRRRRHEEHRVDGRDRASSSP